MDAIHVFQIVFDIQKVKVNFEPSYVRGLFTAHNSNMGYPWFAKETRLIHGQTYRDMSVDFAKKLNAKYGAS